MAVCGLDASIHTMDNEFGALISTDLSSCAYSLFFDVCKVGMKLAGSEQIVIQDFVVLLQISKSALSPHADRACFFGG